MSRGVRDARCATRGTRGVCRVARLRLAAAALVLGGCTELGSDPQAAVAIELEPLPVPSVVIGDTLRDSTGAVVTPLARAINVNNEVIAGAPVRFLALDTSVVAIDSTTGVIVGKRVGTTPVIASIQGLQSERITVAVTLRPDTAYGLDSLQRTMQFSLTSPTAASSGPLRVFVGHDTVLTGLDTAIAVPSYLVRYRIVFPTDGSVSDTDTTKVVLANDVGRPSTVDTTDASGIASRAVRISTAVSVIPDSVIVDAHVSHPDTTNIAGAPVRFVIRILGVP
jgi:hypothetical protein